MITLAEWIRKRRLQRLGHVERMNNNRLSIKALHTRIEGTKSRGRQRKRWIDNVKEDVQEKQGRIQGARGGPGPPIFGKVNFIFLHCIQCLKKYFLN